MCNKTIPFLIATSLLCLSQLTGQANDIEPGKEFYNATRVTTPFVADGNLSEWAGVPVLADPKFSVRVGAEGTAAGKGGGTNGVVYILFEKYAGGNWSGPDDHTSAVQVAWDANNVYFGFVVTDEYHENAANSAWNGDSVQLMIANADRSAQVALYNYALGGVEGAIGEVIVNHEAGPGATDPAAATTGVVTRNATTKKTIYEIKLPAAALGLTAPLTAGTKFGLGMAINDGDETTPGQKGWGGLGAHSIVFGKTPGETALVTLSTNAPGTDRIFFSAINPGIATFTFRATDKGSSIVNAASAKLTIDGQVVTLTSRKTGDATDFTFTRATPFPPGSAHTYSIEVGDSSGSTVADKGTFQTISYALVAAADKVTPDTTKPGFIWNVHQVDSPTDLVNSNARTEQQLAGALGANIADPNAVGPASGVGTRPAGANGPIQFIVPGVINFSQVADEANGSATPDLAMPGIPGTLGTDNNIAGEVLTVIDFPAPGVYRLIVNSDDGFKTTFGKNPRDAFSVVAGEFNGGRGATDSAFDIYVEAAGAYAMRTTWEEGGGGANLEILSMVGDAKVLLNDTATNPQALKTYQLAVNTQPAYVRSVSPGVGASSPFAPKTVEAVLVDGSTQITASSVSLKLNGAAAAVTATKTGGETRVVHTLPATITASEYTAELTFSDNVGARTVTWKFKPGLLGAGTLFIEAEDFNFGKGNWIKDKPIGMNGAYAGGAYQDLGDGLDAAVADGTDNGIDYFEAAANNDQAIYRPTTGVEAGKLNGPAGNARGSFDVTINHTVGWTAAGDWMNYTRIFPTNNPNQLYKVYARTATDVGQTRNTQLSRVTSDPTKPNQTVEVLGTFNAPSTGGWDSWPEAGTSADALVPLRDAAGSEALVKLSGLTTLRYTFLPGASDVDYIAFVPAGTGGLPPKVLSLKPANNSVGQSDLPPIEAQIEDGEVVNVASASLKVDGTEVSPTVTKTGKITKVSFTPSTAFTPGSSHTASLVYTDTASPPVSRTNNVTFRVSFTPFRANTLFIEAEDFNFGKGQWVKDKPIGMSGPYAGGDYRGLGNGVDGSDGDGSDFGIDYFETGANNDGGAVPAYRPTTAVEIAKPNGPAGLNRGTFDVTVNNTVGWTAETEWMNYTRVFPTNTYKVYARTATDVGQTRNTQLSRVTSDPTKGNQTTTVLGIFNGPSTGGWDTWPDGGTSADALLPLKDASGKEVVLSLGGEVTLRYTFLPGASDVDFLAFLPQTSTTPDRPMITGVRKNANGSLTIEWTGGGTLESAASITGPWVPVTGATSPFTFTPTATQTVLFGRIRR